MTHYSRRRIVTDAEALRPLLARAPMSAQAIADAMGWGLRRAKQAAYVIGWYNQTDRVYELRGQVQKA
jgi:hypothetical protein